MEILQRQVSTLADSQSNAEDRTSRTKTEHAVLQARYHMLEDQLREVSYRIDFLFLCIYLFPFWQNKSNVSGINNTFRIWITG